MNRERSEKGAVLVLVAVSMIVLLGLAALVIDGAYLYLTKNQLHVAADAAALAGAAMIVSTTDCTSTSPSSTNNYAARTTAYQFGAFHNAGSQSGQTPVTLALNTDNDPNGDIVLGNFTFTPVSPRTDKFIECPTSDGSPVNAVRVRARRTGETAVPTFFASVLNPAFSTSNVAAEAIAAKTSSEPPHWVSGEDMTFNGCIEMNIIGEQVFFHANEDVTCNGNLTVSGSSSGSLTVSATGTVGASPSGGATIKNGAAEIDIPTVGDPDVTQSFDALKSTATLEGSYYDGDQTFTDLNALSGKTVYVNGNVTLDCGCTVSVSDLTLVTTGTMHIHTNTKINGVPTDGSISVFFISGGDMVFHGNAGTFSNALLWTGGNLTGNGGGNDVYENLYVIAGGNITINGHVDEFTFTDEVTLGDAPIELPGGVTTIGLVF